MQNEIWSRLLREDIVGILMPIAAIMAGAVIVIVKKVFTHRERMAMIERGMHPDHPTEYEAERQNS